MNEFSIITGDALEQLRAMRDDSVDCCVTSPPYWGLRDYGYAGQMGLEDTPEAYTAAMSEVFREVRRVLNPNGTLWLNLGDSYTSGGRATRDADDKLDARGMDTRPLTPVGLKPKDLVGIPWRVAFALQADGWYLRQDIIWHKPNPMPESVTDRPTKAHEYVFLLSKSERYAYDADAIKETAVSANLHDFTGQGYVAPGQTKQTGSRPGKSGNKSRQYGGDEGKRPDDHLGSGVPWEGFTRNRRSVWTITTKPFKDAHFAVMPEELASLCVLAGCPHGGTVLDPFTGAGTTGVAALSHGRKFIGIELNPKFTAMARKRLAVIPERLPLEDVG